MHWFDVMLKSLSNRWLFLTGLVLCCNLAAAQTGQPPPSRAYSLGLSQLAQGNDFKLFGVRNTQQLEFTLRRDQLVTKADLNLVFTPSPALLPKLSHLRVYLNDEMMGVASIENSVPGQAVSRTIPLEPRMMTGFNRVRLEFVGHYTDTCEDLTHSSLWLDISGKTTIDIDQQPLPVVNDLSFFPEPFFDSQDMGEQKIPFVFSGPPSNEQLRAGAILSSFFGSRAKWRQVRYPVHYNTLPEQHVVVFATNDARPTFLADYPAVEAPTIDLVSMPGSPHLKMLLLLGRDDGDLVMAATALAVGNPLLRGQSVSVDAIQELAPRQPYDAPNWIPSDRPVYFSELTDYTGQLEVSGLRPHPITLRLNLPPDLFVWRNNGIPLEIRYRYSPPKNSDESRLNLSLNDRYVQSYTLKASDEQGVFTRLRLPLQYTENASSSEHLMIPALKVGGSNQIRFDFSFASTLGSAQKDMCQTILPVDVRAAIDEHSVIDFSGFRHYLEMPNLGAFAGSGFPFSRMADLSDTVVVAPAQPSTVQVATLLESLALIGGQVGYPALKVRLLNDWDAARKLDADILLIGGMPENLKQRPDANLILQDAQVSLRRPRAAESASRPDRVGTQDNAHAAQDALSKVAVRSLAPMAAIVGMQSDLYPQRSIVGLLASTGDDFNLLIDALTDSGKRAAMGGSVAIIRESGVAGEMVGSSYYVGSLPWWELVWFRLSERPILLAIAAVLLVLLAAVLLRNGLRWVAHRRLSRDA